MARPMLEMRSLLPEFFMPRGCTTADENAAQIPRNREYNGEIWAHFMRDTKNTKIHHVFARVNLRGFVSLW